MAKRPGDRFQTAEEMAEALQRYLDGPPQPAGPPRRIRRLARLAGAGAAAILLLAVIIHLKTEKGTLVLEVGPPDVKVTIDGNQVHIKSPRDEISVRIGDHKLEVSKDGLETRTESFTIRRGGRTEIVARLEPAPPRPADGSTSQDLNWQQTLACPRDWCSQWDGSVTSWNGSIYFIGSKPYGGTPHEGLSWRGDVAADGQVVAWSRVSTSPVARFDGQGVVAANGYIYNVGGESRGYVPTSSVEYAPINVDGTLGEWRTTSALARPVAGAALSAWGNRLYFFGGWGSGRRFSLTAQYAEILTDGSLGPWIDDDSIMNAGHPHGGGVAHDGYLYAIAGGLGSPDTAIVERAAILPDGSLGQWTVDTPLPVACHAFGADIVGDTIFVVAGDVGGVVTS
ncbi:MAG: PEGA domain-containing protein [Planctomycetia bacterium]|nr:PEGA domain-containing protein [Planctomycetia bacterium]